MCVRVVAAFITLRYITRVRCVGICEGGAGRRGWCCLVNIYTTFAQSKSKFLDRVIQSDIYREREIEIG